MISQVITCDVCGKQKQEVNHWWLVWKEGRNLEIEPFRNTNVDLIPQHLCGQECVVKAVNKFMQEQMSAVQDSKEAIEASRNSL